MVTKPAIIFYSWQSDLDGKTNRYAIQHAAKKLVKNSSTITLDQATRGTPGSPNIPETILNKINDSDIFLADISFIDDPQKVGKRCPNPNVVFELGYAVHQLGWERIILVFNTAYGKISDLPFDFKHHRVTTYELHPADEQKKNQRLENSLKTAIDSILAVDPLKPFQYLEKTQEEIQHERDVKMVKWALEQIHIPTIQHHIKHAPMAIQTKALYFLDDIKHVILENKLFHVYDETMKNLLEEFAKAFIESTSYMHEYHIQIHGEQFIFTNPGDLVLPEGREQNWQAINKATVSMKQYLDAIIHRVRTEYRSIDITETNQKAFENINSDRT